MTNDSGSTHSNDYHHDSNDNGDHNIYDEKALRQMQVELRTDRLARWCQQQCCHQITRCKQSKAAPTTIFTTTGITACNANNLTELPNILFTAAKQVDGQAKTEWSRRY